MGAVLAAVAICTVHVDLEEGEEGEVDAGEV